MNPHHKDKGKRKAEEPSNRARSMQPYKAAMQKTPEQLKAEVLEKIPPELRLREHAYSSH